GGERVDEWLTRNAVRAGSVSDRGDDAGSRLDADHRNAHFHARDAGIDGVGRGDRLRAPRVQGGREGVVRAGVAAGERIIPRQHGLGVAATEGDRPSIAGGDIVVGIKSGDGEAIGGAGYDRRGKTTDLQAARRCRLHQDIGLGGGHDRRYGYVLDGNRLAAGGLEGGDEVVETEVAAGES